MKRNGKCEFLFLEFTLDLLEFERMERKIELKEDGRRIKEGQEEKEKQVKQRGEKERGGGGGGG